MMRVPIWATAFALVAGGSLAAPSPSLEFPVRAPRPERATLSEDWSSDAPVLTFEEEVAAEEIVIARKSRKSGGSRGGASRKNRGGFKSGNKRHANRHAGEPGRPGRPGDPGGLRGGEPGRPGRPGDPGGLRGGEPGRPGRPGDPDVRNVRHGDVDVDRRVDVDRDIDIDDDDDELGAALLGGVVGLGIGSMLNAE
jgi:hypothetical protein